MCLSILSRLALPGYRYNADEETWEAEEVFPKWKDRYPEPPDLLGVTRVYEKHIDKPVMSAVQVRCCGMGYGMGWDSGMEYMG